MIRPDIASAITFSLGIALILTAGAILVRSYLQRNAPPLENESNIGRFGDRQLPYTIFTGFVLGVLVTVSSVGAGALGTVALFFLYPRLPTSSVGLIWSCILTALEGWAYAWGREFWLRQFAGGGHTRDMVRKSYNCSIHENLRPALPIY